MHAANLADQNLAPTLAAPLAMAIPGRLLTPSRAGVLERTVLLDVAGFGL